MKLNTKRLLLRPIAADDKREIFLYRSDAEANRFQGWIPKTLNDVDEFIGKTSEVPDVPGTWFQVAVIETAGDKMIGDIGIYFEEDGKQARLGYTISKNHQGKGYATEALTAVVDHLFKDLKKHRITASVDPQNRPSIRVLEKLGFRKEAHHRSSLFLNGKWVDDVVYALLAREWLQSKQ